MANPLGPSGPRQPGSRQPEVPRPGGHPKASKNSPQDLEAARHGRVRGAAAQGAATRRAREDDSAQHPLASRAQPAPGAASLALGLLAPALGVSAAHPHGRTPLPGLPRPYHPVPRSRLRQSLQTLLSGWLGDAAGAREEPLGHAARPVPPLAWRRPQGSAVLTVPLPDAAALAAVGIRARPKWPEPGPKAVAVAVVAKAEEPMGGRGATAPKPADEAAPGAPEPSPAGMPLPLPQGQPAAAPMSMQSLSAPKAPTALVLGLAAPRRPAVSPKAKQARPKKKARPWARWAAVAQGGEVDEAAERPDEPEPSSGGSSRGT